MNVSVTIQLSVPAMVKHWRQMQRIAVTLTDSRASIRVSQPAGDPKRLTVRFTVPQARQVDIVDRIGRKFWSVEDYSDSTIGFSSEPRPKRRSKPQPRSQAKNVEDASEVGIRTSGELSSYWFQVVRVWYEMETPPVQANL